MKILAFIGIYLLLLIASLALCRANRLWEDESKAEHQDIIGIDLLEEKRVYISGPITGTDDAAERFGNAVKQLKLLGFNKIVNPHGLCEVYLYEADYEHYMDLCLTCLNHVDVVYMLKGWERSGGAKRERNKAIAKGLLVIYE